MSVILSPSLSSTSSFDILSSDSSTFSSQFDSDEEIVWPISSGSLSSTEDDYVLLTHTPVSDLVSNLSNLSLSNPSSFNDSLAPPSRPDSAATLVRGKKSGRAGRRARHRNRNALPLTTGLGERPIVDDVSEVASTVGDESTYEDAVTFITSFLTNPTIHDTAAHLTFLQSLIIELGLANSSLPHSLKSAKAILKSKAFVNIRDYLAVRSQGLQAIKDIMYPSKSALIKDIKRKKNTASLPRVKQTGLQVLLVTCYH